MGAEMIDRFPSQRNSLLPRPRPAPPTCEAPSTAVTSWPPRAPGRELSAVTVRERAGNRPAGVQRQVVAALGKCDGLEVPAREFQAVRLELELARDRGAEKLRMHPERIERTPPPPSFGRWGGVVSEGAPSLSEQ